MKKKNKIILLIFIGILIPAISLIGMAVSWSEDYSKILKANWDFELPSSSQYSEIYSRESDAGILGDGIRYHVFTYKKREPIRKMFPWKSEEYSTIFYSRYSEAVDHWLDEIAVPLRERPNDMDCFYWYQSQDDNSEIMILWDQNQDKLYTVESFL